MFTTISLKFFPFISDWLIGRNPIFFLKKMLDINLWKLIFHLNMFIIFCFAPRKNKWDSLWIILIHQFRQLLKTWWLIVISSRSCRISSRFAFYLYWFPGFRLILLTHSSLFQIEKFVIKIPCSSFLSCYFFSFYFFSMWHLRFIFFSILFDLKFIFYLTFNVSSKRNFSFHVTSIINREFAMSFLALFICSSMNKFIILCA